MSAAAAVHAQQEGVGATAHNLAVSGPGEIRSTTVDEVCKFCHIPHSAIAPQPLWGHTLSPVARYETSRLRSAAGFTPAPQPDGSSRLCLSCHDGTVALGEIAGAGRVTMAGPQRLGPGQRGHLGTDLSGGHPISFSLRTGESTGRNDGADIGLRPSSSILLDAKVRLDRDGKMQCTTCHDPHSDRYSRADRRVPGFWVAATVEEVCLACHELR